MVVSLDKFQTFHALQKTKTADFTGAHITSDKPVSFLSGNLKVAVPVNGGTMDHLTEMLTLMLWAVEPRVLSAKQETSC